MVIIQDNTRIMDKWLAGWHADTMLWDRDGRSRHIVWLWPWSHAVAWRAHAHVGNKFQQGEVVQDKGGDDVHIVKSATV